MLVAVHENWFYIVEIFKLETTILVIAFTGGLVMISKLFPILQYLEVFGHDCDRENSVLTAYNAEYDLSFHCNI